MGLSLFLRICLLVLIVVPAKSAHDLGNELPLSVQPGGRPHFNVAFDYEAEIFWMITFKSAISNAEYEALPGKIYWSVWSEREQRLLAPWNKVHKRELRTGTIKIIDRMVLTELLPWQKDARIVFSMQLNGKHRPIYHLDVGGLCRDHERQFFDIARDDVGCVVNPAVVKGWAEECRQIADSLTVRILQKLISCRWAQKVFMKQGCGQYICEGQD